MSCLIQGKIDNEIADYMNITPYRAFLLRQMYANENSKGEDIIAQLYDNEEVEMLGKKVTLSKEERLAKIAEALNNFQIDKKYIQSGLNTASTNVSATFKNLFQAIPSARDRISAIESITQMLQMMIDYHQQTKGISRQDVCNDKENGTLQLLSIIKNQFRTAKIGSTLAIVTVNGQKEKIKIETQEQLDLAKSIYNNFEAISVFALSRLQTTEGLKFNKSLGTATESNLADLNKNNIEELFNFETSHKEHWQDIIECLSPMSTVGKYVRSTLSRIPKYETLKTKDGYNIKVAKNALGFIEYEKPSEMHQKLMRVLRGMTSSRDMINRLEHYCEDENSNPVLVEQINIILDKISPSKTQINKIKAKGGNYLDYVNVCNQMISAFYSDLKRNSSKYAIFNINRLPNNIISYVRKYINTALDYTSFYDNYITLIRTNAVYNSDSVTSMFHGSIDDAMNAIKGFTDDNGEEHQGIIKDIANLESNKLTFKQKTELLQQILNNIGIGCNLGQCYELMKNKKFLKRLKNIKVQLDKVVGVQNNTKQRGQALYKNTHELFAIDLEDIKGSKSALQENKPKYNSGLAKAFHDISRYIVTEQMGDVLDAGLYKKEGKFVRMYTDVLPSYMGDRIEELKSAVEEGSIEKVRDIIADNFLVNNMYVKMSEHVDATDTEHAIPSYILDVNGNMWDRNGDVPPAIRCYWLRELWNSDLSDEFSFANNFDWDRVLGNTQGKNGWRIDSVDFSEMDINANAVQMIRNFLYREEIENNRLHKFDFANYPVFILGDANVFKTITAPRLNPTNKENVDENQWVNILHDIYLQERERMKIFEATNKKLKDNNYEEVSRTEDNKAKYTFLTFLNNIEGFEDEDELTQKQIIKDAIEQEVEKFQDRMRKLGLYELTTQTNEKGEVVSVKEKYFKGKNTTEKINDLMRDFYINNKIAMINQLQMMTVDVGYYKDSKDLQKRYKEIHAPGNEVDVYATWDGEYILGNRKDQNGQDELDDFGNKVPDITRKGFYFKDIRGSIEEYDPIYAEVCAHKFGVLEAAKRGMDYTTMTNQELIELGKTTEEYDLYRDCTYTDGQSFITKECFRKVQIMRGLWDLESERAYKEIDTLCKELKNKNLTESEKLSIQQRIIDLSVIFQAQKPYSFGHERYQLIDDEEALIPVQYKCAEAVIIPEILPEGSKLRVLGEFLQDKGLDYACSTECIKVGNFGAIDIDRNADNSIMTASQMKQVLYGKDAKGNQAYIHKTKWTDYKIQTNVPAHMTGERGMGTQVRKIIIGGVNKRKNYSSYFKTDSNVDGNITLDGVHGTITAAPTGQNLINFYNSLIACNIYDSLHQFKNKIGDVKQFSKMLQNNVLNTGRYSMTDLLNFALNGDLSGFETELYEGGNVHDSAALLLSMFRKLVNKQMFNGYSLVQVTAWGISSNKQLQTSKDLKAICSPNSRNILYYQCERPFVEEYTDQYGRTQKLKFEEYCNSDGTLKMSDQTTDDIEYASWRNPNYKKGDSENTKYLIPKIELDFKGILDQIAYRIPTERNYSVLNLKTVRFNSPTSGATIKVPIQTTVVAGFDFDIDKLYMLRKSFMQKNIESLIDKEFRKKYEEKNGVSPEFDVYKTIYERLSEKKGVNIITKLKKAREEYNKVNKKNPAKDLHEVWDLVDELKDEDKQEWFNKVAQEKGIIQSPYQWMDYDWSKAASEQTNEGSKIKNVVQNKRNNALFHLMRCRLMDEETLQSRITPGGFANAKIAARVLRELMYNGKGTITDQDALIKKVSTKEWAKKDPEPNWDPTDAYTLLYYNQQNQAAAKLIGIFANANTFKQYASVAQEIKLVKAFKLMGHEYNDLLNSPTNRDSDLTLAELLAASVDAVKDPVLNYLNLNQSTASIACLLGAIGYNLTEIGVFLNQPIIKEAVQISQQSGTSLSKAIKRVLSSEQHKEHFKKLDIEDFSEEQIDSYLTFDKLAQQIRGQLDESVDKDYTKDEQDTITQFLVAHKLMEIFPSANDFTALIQSTKFTASNAVTSTFGGLYNQQMKINKFYQGEVTLTDGTIQDNGLSNIKIVANRESNIFSPIMNDGNILEQSLQEYVQYTMQTPFAFEQAMFDSNKALLNIIKAYFPYETYTYKKVREYASNTKTDGVVSAETIDALHDEILISMLESMPRSGFNPNVIHHMEGDTEITNKQYFTVNFPHYLIKMRQSTDIAEKFPFLKDLIFKEINDEDNNISYYTINYNKSAFTEAFSDEDFIQSWQQMAEDENYADIAFGLFFYNFHTGGFKYGYNSFMDKCPNYIKAHLRAGVIDGNIITYQELLEQIRKGDYSELGYGFTQFLWRFIQKNPNNYDFVKPLYGNEKGQDRFLFHNALVAKAAQQSDDSTVTSITLNSNGENSELYNSLLLGKKIIKMQDGTEVKVEMFPMAVSVNGEIYIANYDEDYVDSVMPANATEDGKITYTKVESIPQKVLDGDDRINSDNKTIEEIYYDYITASDDYKQIKNSLEQFVEEYLEENKDNPKIDSYQTSMLKSLLDDLAILPMIKGENLADMPIIDSAKMFDNLLGNPQANRQHFKNIVINNLLKYVFNEAVEDLAQDHKNALVDLISTFNVWNVPSSWQDIRRNVLKGINQIRSQYSYQGEFEISDFKFADTYGYNYANNQEDVDFMEDSEITDQRLQRESEMERQIEAQMARTSAEELSNNPQAKICEDGTNHC